MWRVANFVRPQLGGEKRGEDDEREKVREMKTSQGKNRDPI